MFDDARRGIGTGVFFGLFFAVVGTVGYLAGSDSAHQAGISLPVMWAIYLSGGVLIGALAGSARRFVRGRLSAAALGIAIMLPVSGLTYCVLKGVTWTVEHWPVIPMAAVLFGVMGASVLYTPPHAPQALEESSDVPSSDKSRPEAGC